MPDLKKDPVLQQFEEILKPGVEYLLPYMTQPNNPLQNTKKVEQDILDSLTGNDIQSYVEDGFAAIGKEMHHVCSEEERRKVLDEWSDSSEHFSKYVEDIFSKTEEDQKSSMPPSDLESVKKPAYMKDFLGISEQTINIFYKCGCHLFEQQNYKDAYNVFFIVGYLDNTRTNAWISLGLSAKRNHDVQRALKAFGIATVVNPSIVLPLIYSAQCYAELNDYKNAIAALTLAEEIAHAFPERNSPEQLKNVQDLKIKYKTRFVNK